MEESNLPSGVTVQPSQAGSTVWRLPDGGRMTITRLEIRIDGLVAPGFVVTLAAAEMERQRLADAWISGKWDPAVVRVERTRLDRARADEQARHDSEEVRLGRAIRELHSRCSHAHTHRESNPAGELHCPTWCDDCGAEVD